ncbi:MAG: dihydroorotate dehydrogenase electron transfer subunit [Planctomycetia bacterium]
MTTASCPSPATAQATPCYADTAGYVAARIVANTRIADNTWRLRLDCPSIASAALPGQFAMLRIPGRSDPLLARPLAFYDTFSDETASRSDGPPHRYADFVYAVHGRFTTALREVPAGHEMVIWGPLGNGFQIPAVDHLVLVAGGIGQTALLGLGRERLGQKSYGPAGRMTPPRAGRVTCCWGARHAGLFGGVEDYRAAGIDVHQATLDGSVGLRGTVVDLLDSLFGEGHVQNDVENHARGGDTLSPSPDVPARRIHVACCGPDPMMAAVARWTAARDIPCDVSLEAPMACGIGICFTCVARVRDAEGGWDYRRTCIEGPVFDATRIEW